MTTPAARTINIPELLAHSSVGPLQKRVFILCALCLIIDGFDVQAMGYVAPALVPDWKIDRSALGPVFSAANFGVLIGSLVFSTIADTIGRGPALVSALLVAALQTVAAALTQNVELLFSLRLVAGTIMGCMIPDGTAPVAE